MTNMGDAIYFLELAYEVRTIVSNLNVPLVKAMDFVKDKYELGESEYTMVNDLVKPFI
jgi:hypothetical protein